MTVSLVGTFLLTIIIPTTSYAVPLNPDEIHKKKVTIHKCLLAICVTQKNKPKIIKEYVSLIALTPNDAKLRLDYGTYLSRTGNYKKAIIQLKKAASLNPTDPDIWGIMGITYLKLKNHKAGLESLGKAVQLGGKKYRKTYEDARKFIQAVNQREAIRKQQAEQKRLIDKRNSERKKQQQDKDEDW